MRLVDIADEARKRMAERTKNPIELAIFSHPGYVWTNCSLSEGREFGEFMGRFANVLSPTEFEHFKELFKKAVGEK
jgi:hypothetical protein